MIFGVYAMHDRLAGYLTPTVEINDAVAMRNFEHAVLTSNSIINSHSDDFNLCKIATFDSNSGEIKSVFPVEVILTGAAVQVQAHMV